MNIKAINKTNIEKACRRLNDIQDLFKEYEAADRGNRYGMSRESLMLGIYCKNKQTVDYNYNEHIYEKVKTLLDEIESLYTHVYNAAISREKYLKKIKNGNSNLEDLYNKMVDDEIKRLNDVFTMIRPPKASVGATGNDGNNDGGNDGSPEPHLKNKKKNKAKKESITRYGITKTKQVPTVSAVLPQLSKDEDCEIDL